MLGKQTVQMGFGDMEATSRVPDSHFLKKHSPLDFHTFGKFRKERMRV